MRFELFIARRYLRAKRRQAFIGIITGIVASKVIAMIKNWSSLVSPTSIIVAFIVSAGVGVFFGFYPARKAAQLDPIDALRAE